MISIEFYTDQVRHLRESACMPIGSGINADHALHLRLLTEEQQEYIDGTITMDRRMMADALGDIVVVACGYSVDAEDHALIDVGQTVLLASKAAEAHLINLPGAFMLIYESNMSKLCTEEQRDPTVRKYAELGVELEFRDAGNGLWSVFAANDTAAAPKGKWLKGVGYREPNWESIEIWQF